MITNFVIYFVVFMAVLLGCQYQGTEVLMVAAAVLAGLTTFVVNHNVQAQQDLRERLDIVIQNANYMAEEMNAALEKISELEQQHNQKEPFFDDSY